MFANNTTTMLEIAFESVQQKNLDKTTFHHQVVDFVWKKPHKPALYPFVPMLLTNN